MKHSFLRVKILKFPFTPFKYSCYLSPWIPLFFPTHSRGEVLSRKKTVQEYICQKVTRAKDLSSKDGGYSQFLFSLTHCDSHPLVGENCSHRIKERTTNHWLIAARIDVLIWITFWSILLSFSVVCVTAPSTLMMTYQCTWLKNTGVVTIKIIETIYNISQ